MGSVRLLGFPPANEDESLWRRQAAVDGLRWETVHPDSLKWKAVPPAALQWVTGPTPMSGDGWIPTEGLDVLCGPPHVDPPLSAGMPATDHSGFYPNTDGDMDGWYSIAADELHKFRPCRIDLRSSPTWGALNAWLPDSYHGLSTEREVARDWLPTWCAAVLDSPTFNPEQAKANISSQKAIFPGLFYTSSDGYYIEAMARALATYYACAELAMPPEVFREPANHLTPGNIRRQLRLGNWKVRLVQDMWRHNYCKWSRWNADCCENRTILLRIDPTSGQMVICNAPEFDVVVDGRLNCTGYSPGGITPRRTVNVCDGKRGNAIAADYLFWWAARLHAVLKDAAHLDVAEAKYLGFSELEYHTTSREWEERIRNTGQACARLGLAFLVELGSLFAHEFCHASRFINSRRNVHCQYGGIANECYHYMFEYTFRHHTLAEFGLPWPRLGQVGVAPFDVREDSEWTRSQVDICSLGQDRTNPAENYAVQASHCGLLALRRQVKLRYWWPMRCSSSNTLAMHSEVEQVPSPTGTIGNNITIGTVEESFYTELVFNEGNNMCDVDDPGEPKSCEEICAEFYDHSGKFSDVDLYQECVLKCQQETNRGGT